MRMTGAVNSQVVLPGFSKLIGVKGLGRGEHTRITEFHRRQYASLRLDLYCSTFKSKICHLLPMTLREPQIFRL